MKNILFIIYFISITAVVNAQNRFEQQFTAKDLGFENAEIMNVSILDDRFVYFLVKDDQGDFYPYVLDNHDKSVINPGLVQGVGQVLLYNNTLEIEGRNNLPDKVYKDGKIYFPGIAGNKEEYLVIYDLIQRDAKAYRTQGSNNFLIAVGEKEGKIYIALTGNRYNIYELRENDLQLLYDHEYAVTSFVILLYNGLHPLFDLGKFFIPEREKLLAYDVISGALDTLAEFDYSTGDPMTSVVFAQSTGYEGKRYFVYKNAKINDDNLWYHLFEGYIGDAIVIETDGTPAGTKELFRYDTGDSITGNFLSLYSSLIILNEQLYWLGVNNKANNLSVYEVVAFGLKRIGTLERQAETDSEKKLLYTYSYPLSLSNPQFLVYRIKGLDYILINNTYGDSTDMIGDIYWDLWTVRNNEIHYQLKHHPVCIAHQYQENGQEKTEKNIMARLIDVTNESLFLYTFKNIEDGILRVPESYKVTVSAIDLKKQNSISIDSLSSKDSNADFFFQTILKNGDGIFFIFPDDTTATGSSSWVLWKYDLQLSTSVKNDKIKKELFVLYPNPTAQFLTIQSADNLSGQIMIAGMDGKIHQTLRIDGYHKQINISNLPSGMYVAVYSDASRSGSTNFIKH